MVPLVAVNVPMVVKVVVAVSVIVVVRMIVPGGAVLKRRQNSDRPTAAIVSPEASATHG